MGTKIALGPEANKLSPLHTHINVYTTVVNSCIVHTPVQCCKVSADEIFVFGNSFTCFCHNIEAKGNRVTLVDYGVVQINTTLGM